MGTKKSEQTNTRPVCVVGIGASAGGLEALQQFLTFLPADTGMAFVIIQHLSPDHKSLLSEILAKYTIMPVTEVTNEMPVRRNHIYLIPPKFNIEISEGILTLKEFDHTRINYPIDIFLRSLAKEYENHAVAVIMSGTGSDGTNGIKAIREQNGVIIVQSPESSKFDGMPRNAIATGFEDMILNPDSIAREMAHIADSVRSSSDALRMTDEDMLSQIFSILKSATNVNYTFYKQTTILRRIERRMVVTHNRNFREYVSFLKNNPDEANTLAKEVLIGVTAFFRDPDYFEILKNNVITPILRDHPTTDQVRVWVAGCSTGEEAYSIAILFAEVMEELQIKRDIKIFATDLDADAIAFASRGIYGDNIIEDVSLNRLSKYFTRRGYKYVVNQDIRRMIVFAQHNVFQDPPFGKLDLISCRNLLIYFQNVLQKNLFAIFHIALNDRGFLFLGKSESVAEFNDVFKVYCASEKIFIHNASGRMPGHTHVNYSLQSITTPVPLADTSRAPSETEVSYNVSELDTSVLESLLPATVLVDDQNCLQHVYGDCSNFLSMPAGSITLDIFSLIRTDLKIAVSKALKEVRGGGKTVSYDKIPIKEGSTAKYATMAAVPISDKIGMNTGIVALTFVENRDIAVPANEHFDIDSASAERIADLERELHQSQDNLKHTVTELESVNAELQAANEELMTANEELQSSNEELQSVNEELYTVNSEYQAKVGELASVNDDMANFLSTTLVGILMVDNQLNIRKYTEYIADEFNVADQDVGRSLRYIAYNFTSIDLIDLSTKVQQTKTPVEKTCTSIEGKTYLVRIAPYRSHHVPTPPPADNNTKKIHEKTDEQKAIEGLVITFVDTSAHLDGGEQMEQLSKALKTAARRSKEKDTFLSRMSHDMKTPMTAIDGLLDLSLQEKKLSPALKENLRKMKLSSSMLANILSDVLETSQITAGKTVRIDHAVPEDFVLNEVSTIFRERAQAQKILFKSTMKGSDNTYAMIDTEHLSRILMNLLDNAVKFTKPGGSVSINLQASYPDKTQVKHVYTIKDNGCGINQSFMERMFMPFEQANTEYANDKTGTGLGLYIARSLIDVMGGTITCSSEPGKGTEFQIAFTFRIATEEQMNMSNRKLGDLESHILYGKNILIVEDNNINAEVIMKILETKGMHSDLAMDGKEALEFFKSGDTYRYQGIIMDIRMPVMDGIEATKRIRAMGRTDSGTIPIIGLTADSIAEIEEECLSAGMTAILPKPINSDSLFYTLAHALMQLEKDSMSENSENDVDEEESEDLDQ